MLFTKSTLDLIAALFLASSYGIGVAFAAAAVLVYQGTFVLFASFIAPFLSDLVVTEISAVGSILLLGLGLNMLDVTKLRIMNTIPAILLPIVLVPLFAMFFG